MKPNNTNRDKRVYLALTEKEKDATWKLREALDKPLATALRHSLFHKPIKDYVALHEATESLQQSVKILQNIKRCKKPTPELVGLVNSVERELIKIRRCFGGTFYVANPKVIKALKAHIKEHPDAKMLDFPDVDLTTKN